ncbi:YigZ family protein [Spiractinospora alimapuensis]|uniref:YigZ family protein n=1 Tax=Spiractinospora alimapuensis TaxID=2820884 RepID=UPI001F19A1FD|nr:YigZ family protein [Spiractinospora alimapuensis]QVQ50597.1 YigZ family protein [Spiractinospora alimapuensis]
MRTVRGGGEHEVEIKKSRFLCSLARVDDEDAARAFIAERRKLHWNATHNCTAYILGEHRDIQRSNDDGEPAGTAGLPMLEVLRHRDLTDTVAVVTRYFGGTKLGVGGLIRAYGNAVGQAVDAIGVVEFRSMAIVSVITDYTQAGRLESVLRGSAYGVEDTRYTEVVTFQVLVPEGQEARFTDWVAERTGGAASVAEVEHRLVEVDPTVADPTSRPAPGTGD